MFLRFRMECGGGVGADRSRHHWVPMAWRSPQKPPLSTQRVKVMERKLRVWGRETQLTDKVPNTLTIGP